MMTLPTFFLPHGGGPCFFMDPDGGPADPMWQPMQAYLASRIDGLPERPRAILLISGHWEDDRVTVHSGDGQPLLFDYYGFPEHTYRLRWDAPGSPEVAARAKALIEGAGFPVGEESERGWDHGVFIPMMVTVPGADIPLVQLSLRRDLDPAAHIAIGRALAPLRDEGVLIVGSGMSFHNLRARGPQVTPVADEWDAALVDAVTDPDPVPVPKHGMDSGPDDWWSTTVGSSQLCGACHNVKVDDPTIFSPTSRQYSGPGLYSGP